MCAASITLPCASRTSPARARSTRACSACRWRRVRTWASPARGTTWAARSSISSSSGRCSRTSTRPNRTSRSGWTASSGCDRRSTRAAAVTALACDASGACGFRGNQEEYYDPRNSYLTDVLERRTGIPITLSVVLIETGARLGLGIEGVGFPGHFLVRVAGSRGPLLLDPFYGGRPIGERELLARYRTFVGGDAPALPPDALATTGTPAILSRMLRNLLRAYLDQKDHALALAAADLLLVLVPDSADEVRVRGLLYEHLECFGAALGDFRRYLELAPAAPDAERIRERVARLVRIATALH